MFPSASNPNCMPRLSLVIMLATLLISTNASALPEDKDQPIKIAADTAVRDEKQGTTVYSGNVRMNQGTLNIDADTITIYHTGEDASRIVAAGTPAQLEQQPEIDKALLKAEAATIEYFKNEERVQLREAARIEQDGSIVTGDTIDYFMAEQLVKADSSARDTGNRVEVVIPAQTVQENQ